MSALANLEPGERRLECPKCGRGPRDKTMGVTVEAGGAAVGHCFRCENVETYRPDWSAAHRSGKAASRPVAPLKRETPGDKEIAPATWLDKHRAVVQLAWHPAEPALITDRVLQVSGWARHDGAAVFNLYRNAERPKGDAGRACVGATASKTLSVMA